MRGRRRGRACSGYLVEHDGFRLLIDPGYAVTPLFDPAALDAVFVSHGHPDHCADLNPLLRARVLGPERVPPLPVCALAGAVDPVLAEATFPERVPDPDAPYLSTAAQAGRDAATAAVGRLVLTHLWPGTSPDDARAAAAATFTGQIDVARPGLVIDL